MAGCRPESVKEVAFPTEKNSAPVELLNVPYERPPNDLSTSYPDTVLPELLGGAQDRLICEGETALAVRFAGASTAACALPAGIKAQNRMTDARARTNLTGGLHISAKTNEDNGFWSDISVWGESYRRVGERKNSKALGSCRLEIPDSTTGCLTQYKD